MYIKLIFNYFKNILAKKASPQTDFEGGSDKEGEDDEVFGGLFTKTKRSEGKIQTKKDLNAPENTRHRLIVDEIDYDQVDQI